MKNLLTLLNNKRHLSTTLSLSYASSYNYKKDRYDFPFINMSETKDNLENILLRYQNKSDINVELYLHFVTIHADEYIRDDIVSIDHEYININNKENLDIEVYTNVLTNIIHREVPEMENYFSSMDKPIKLKDIFVLVVVTHLQ